MNIPCANHRRQLSDQTAYTQRQSYTSLARNKHQAIKSTTHRTRVAEAAVGERCATRIGERRPSRRRCRTRGCEREREREMRVGGRAELNADRRLSLGRHLKGVPVSLARCKRTELLADSSTTVFVPSLLEKKNENKSVSVLGRRRASNADGLFARQPKNK